MSRSSTRSRHHRRILIGGAPVIAVTGDTDFGDTVVGTPLSEVFTIENTGDTDLELTLPVTVPSGFTVTSQPALTTLTPGQTTTFTVQATAATAATFSGNISIVNNSSENPKLVAITVDVSALLFGDEFTIADAAPLASPANADTRGVWVTVDIEGLMSVGSGILDIPSQASAVWAEEYRRAQPNSGQQYWERPAGHALVAVATLSHSTRGEEMIGWWPSATLNSSPEASAYTLSNNFRTRQDANSVSDSLGYSATTDYPVIAVWSSLGFQTITKINGIWQRQWIKNKSVTQAYCGMSNLSSAGNLKNFRIYAIDETLFAPQVSIAGPLVSGAQVDLPDGDFILLNTQTQWCTVGQQRIGIRSKTEDVDGWYLAYKNNGLMDLVEFVNSTFTNRGSGGEYYQDGARSLTISRGSTVANWSNLSSHPSTLSWSYASAYNWLRNVGMYWKRTNGATDGTMTALTAYKARLLDAGSLGSELVVDGSMSSSVTNWPAVGTPTTRQYSSGRLQIITDALNEGAQQTISGLTVGEYYAVSVDYQVVSGSLSIGIESNAVRDGITGTGTFIFTFVATATSHNLRFLSSTAASQFFIDNASVKLQQFAADSLALVLDGLAA